MRIDVRGGKNTKAEGVIPADTPKKIPEIFHSTTSSGGGWLKKCVGKLYSQRGNQKGGGIAKGSFQEKI